MRIDYKGYIIRNKPNDPNSLEITVGSANGRLPKFLDGIYTKSEYALKAIDAYLDMKKEKEDAKKVTEVGG